MMCELAVLLRPRPRGSAPPPPSSFPLLLAALLSALILVVFAHLKPIMKCMHWAKQAINQNRCVSR